jgi:hypothetical protein
VRAQDNDAFAFSQSHVQVLAPIDWNRGAPLVIGRFQSDSHLNVGAKKIPQRSPRYRARTGSFPATGKSHIYIPYGSRPIIPK